ncbi:hypothetical protein TRFO_31210 [Tritrichomonas foetus]|uniref:Uncharacterized protein n=1 Tax=Tritrichomonas foetus TaxID=1144522 RepID=A0A1J4JX66_9EUKA|nr:hypothetical protein TRFO_31210 [Tritrichomonas foetus]|eukprot:OHT01869.1 hypothetical protein TRFO_31210 [Tritrichomonas foetus]
MKRFVLLVKLNKMELNEFQNLIEQMISNNLLEQQYQNLVESNPLQVIQNLISIIPNVPNSNTSIFAIVLLGRLISVLSGNLLQLGNSEFHSYLLQSLFSFLGSPIFSQYSLNLLSNVISRISLTYNSTFPIFPSIVNLIQSDNLFISAAALDALFLCILNGSIEYQPIADKLSTIISTAFALQPPKSEIILPTLKILYLTFDSLPKNYSTEIISFFEQFTTDTNILLKAINDLAAYLPYEKYSFFAETSRWFINYFSEILKQGNIPNQIKCCSLEILSDFREIYYNVFFENHETILTAIYFFLYYEELESHESKDTISKIATLFGGLIDFSLFCYSLFLDNILNSDIRHQIAAMKLLSYCFGGIFVHLSIELPEEYFGAILESRVMDHEHSIVRKIAFEMLGNLFKPLSKNAHTFNVQLFYPKMLECLEDSDQEVMTVKIRALYHYLEIFETYLLNEISVSIQMKLIQLVNRSTEDQLHYIFKCFNVLLKNSDAPDNIIRQYTLYILQNPQTVSSRIYCLALENLSFFQDVPEEIYLNLFPFLLSIDVSLLGSNELKSIALIFHQICNSKSHLIDTLRVPIFNFIFRISEQDIQMSSVPLSELSSTLNQNVSVDRRDNIIRCYNGSQIQLIIFSLKILRCVIRSISPDLLQPFIQQIIDILLIWTAVDFSDVLLYNALKTYYVLCCIVPNSSLPIFMERTFKFAETSTQQRRLESLYTFIHFYIYIIGTQNQLNSENYSITYNFLLQEIEKSKIRRINLNNQLNTGDCTIFPDTLSCIDRYLGKIMTPFFTSNADINYSDLIILALSETSIVNITIVNYYFLFKEKNPDIPKYIITSFLNDSSQTNYFGITDAKEAGICLYNFILNDLLPADYLVQILTLCKQKESFNTNCDLYAGIALLIFQKLGTNMIDVNIILSVLENLNSDIVINQKIRKYFQISWEIAFPYIIQHLWTDRVIICLLDIVASIEDLFTAEESQFQFMSLLSLYKGDRKKLAKRALLNPFYAVMLPNIKEM